MNDRLYQLLPAIYRIRDAEEGEPLRALLALIDEEFARVEEDVARLYDNWFIETAGWFPILVICWASAFCTTSKVQASIASARWWRTRSATGGGKEPSPC